MKIQNTIFPFIIVAFFLQISCNKYFAVENIEPNIIAIDSSHNSNYAINTIVGPYKYRLEREMGLVLATSEMEMPKEKPESLLGNFLADAVLEEVQLQIEDKIDFCILNYGGIRLPNLPKGNITKGMVYELLPFDNYLVVVEMDSNLIEAFFSHFAKKGGWPISKAVNFEISTVDTSAKNILINNKVLSSNKIYKVLIPDYIANGGDSCEMLKPLPQNNSGLFLRDALISYLSRNSNISSKIENRITIK